MRRLARLRGLICVGVLTLAAGGPSGAENLFADLTEGTPDVVAVADGQVRGYAADGVSSFLGIPYAAPPTGDLRWRPPAAAEPWTGIRDAGAFGDSCVQTTTYGVFAEPSRSEDCLYLNVFAPSESRERKRPVMVWIHGGSLINGRADDYDGRKLAADGDAVVVTINYRLNVFGYFAQADIDAEDHPIGNYGTLDQQAALRWVRDNIRAFGGDPENVTLFGEFAGGLAVLFNLVSPAAEGLFHNAILVSGVSASPQMSLEAAEAKGGAFAEAMGCSDAEDVAACLRAKSVDEIIEAGDFTGDSMRVVDGEILPDQMQSLMAAGRFNQVPILIGNNHDEWTWFVSFAELGSGAPLSAEGYLPAYASSYGEENAARIAAEYPLEDYASPSDAAAAAGTARNFVCPSNRIMASASAEVPVYVYEFMDRDAPFYFPEVSYPYGAAHTLDLQYIFPLYHGATGTPHELSEAQATLSDTMVAYWTNFARSGDPNGAGLPDWPQWRSETPQIQLLDDAAIETAATSGVDRKCEFWDAL